MSLWHCLSCTAAYAVGLEACPQCGSTKYSEEEPMPRITVHGGPTVPGAQPGEVGYVAPPAEPEPEPVAEPAAEPEAAVEPQQPPVDQAAAAGEPPVAEEAAPAADADVEDAGETADKDAGEDGARPSSSASKTLWAQWAHSRGLSPAETRSMTKAQLQAWEPPQ